MSVDQESGVFVCDKDRTELYLKADAAGIHPLVLLYDGLPYTTFEDDPTLFVRVADAIAWHEKELTDTRGSSGNRKVADALTDILAKFRAGDLPENPAAGLA